MNSTSNSTLNNRPKPDVESPLRALLTALIVALVCALLVSIAAVSLRPRYQANLDAERMSRLTAIVQALKAVRGEVTASAIESRVVHLDSGGYTDYLDPDIFDARKATTDPDQSIALAPESDIAGIKRRANHAVVYLIHDSDDQPSVVILPVWGVGYQSALYGYLALAADAREILALKFYEQGETPGLGSRIQDPAWEALWPGKQAYNRDGEVEIEIGGSGHQNDISRIDGITGATRTSHGVDTLIRFWLGELGFGPYLTRLRRGEL